MGVELEDAVHRAHHDDVRAQRRDGGGIGVAGLADTGDDRRAQRAEQLDHERVRPDEPPDHGGQRHPGPRRVDEHPAAADVAHEAGEDRGAGGVAARVVGRHPASLGRNRAPSSRPP